MGDPLFYGNGSPFDMGFVGRGGGPYGGGGDMNGIGPDPSGYSAPQGLLAGYGQPQMGLQPAGFGFNEAIGPGTGMGPSPNATQTAAQTGYGGMAPSASYSSPANQDQANNPNNGAGLAFGGVNAFNDKGQLSPPSLSINPRGWGATVSLANPNPGLRDPAVAFQSLDAVYGAMTPSEAMGKGTGSQSAAAAAGIGADGVGGAGAGGMGSQGGMGGGGSGAPGGQSDAGPGSWHSGSRGPIKGPSPFMVGEDIPNQTLKEGETVVTVKGTKLAGAKFFNELETLAKKKMDRVAAVKKLTAALGKD